MRAFGFEWLSVLVCLAMQENLDCHDFSGGGRCALGFAVFASFSLSSLFTESSIILERGLVSSSSSSRG